MTKISKIEKISINSRRYDIQTSTNNFYANGILVHNSMIRPVPIGDTYRLGTKMGITDVAMQAEVWLTSHPNYNKFICECIFNECTPIFEWCSRKQRIVIDYPEDRLVLTAIRNNATGQYLNIVGLRSYATAFDLDIVREYVGTVKSMESLLAETQDLQGQEGWIIRFDDGHMLKLKGKEYVTIHKAKDNILREWGVIELILDEKSDDIKPFLLDEDRVKLEEFETAFWHGIQDTAAKWDLAYYDTKQMFGTDRKGFALDWAPRFDQSLRGAIFKAWDDSGFNFREYLIEVVRKSLSTQAKIDATRHLWGDAKWNINNAE